ncbi:MAG: hypothetical protein HQL61_16905, partial [Magnetococcales bacterium]|nr:hypothetical protein [Nitrospirota bacterium]
MTQKEEIDVLRQENGSTPNNRGHAATAIVWFCRCLGGRPRRGGSTHNGNGTLILN